MWGLARDRSLTDPLGASFKGLSGGVWDLLCSNDHRELNQAESYSFGCFLPSSPRFGQWSRTASISSQYVRNCSAVSTQRILTHWLVDPEKKKTLTIIWCLWNLVTTCHVKPGSHCEISVHLGRKRTSRGDIFGRGSNTVVLHRTLKTGLKTAVVMVLWPKIACAKYLTASEI